MAAINNSIISTENYLLPSVYLQRNVCIDLLVPGRIQQAADVSLLLINDGQHMRELGLEKVLSGLNDQGLLQPLVCVGIHCGEDRKNEYGTASIPDYKGRGAKAELYTQFVFEELLPFVRKQSGIQVFKDKSFAGFSLGGLSALDIVWNHPTEFLRAGVFSGSFWWRSRGLDEGYVEDTDRIMHARIRDGKYYPWLKFFFQTGAMDETEDRNNNGIIDSIDDTLGLIAELKRKGYNSPDAITYLELSEGRHDIATWAKAMPGFLQWGWGK